MKISMYYLLENVNFKDFKLCTVLHLVASTSRAETIITRKFRDKIIYPRLRSCEKQSYTHSAVFPQKK